MLAKAIRAARPTGRAFSTSVVRQNKLDEGCMTLPDGSKPRVLITGGRGQLGRGLADELARRYGQKNVILSDISFPSKFDAALGYTQYIDVTDYRQYREHVAENVIDWIIHLPALLSATCEANIPLAMKINVDTMHNAFRIADEFKCRLFIPSSIGAFGPNSPLEAVPDMCIQDPTTYYGVSKVYAEMLGSYFNVTRGMDFRCLRYPGIISPVAEPGGGTTDYAVDIYKKVIGEGDSEFVSYLQHDARLPMMLEDDCVQGTCDFLATENEKLTRRVYNLGAIDFTPAEVAASLQKHADFDMHYEVDPLRQSIAENWPKVFLDDGARADWGWVPQCGDVDSMTEFMIENIPKSKNPNKKKAKRGLTKGAKVKKLKAAGLSESEIKAILG